MSEYVINIAWDFAPFAAFALMWFVLHALFKKRARAEYAMRAATITQTLMVLIERDPLDPEYGRMKGRVRFDDLQTLVEYLAGGVLAHDHFLDVKASFPRDV